MGVVYLGIITMNSLPMNVLPFMQYRLERLFTLYPVCEDLAFIVVGRVVFVSID